MNVDGGRLVMNDFITEKSVCKVYRNRESVVMWVA